jgi:hypothetical protein
MKISYFDKFKPVQYVISENGDSRSVTNFTPGFKVRTSAINNAQTYINYKIGDGERPDSASTRLYGTPEYYWTFFVINNHLRNGISSWPLSYYQLEEVISKKYDDYACMTMDPISPVVSEGSAVVYGNMSYLPDLSKYSEILNIHPIDEDGTILDIRSKVVGYDYSRLQLMLSRTLTGGSGMSVSTFVNNYTAYAIRAQGTSSLALEYKNLVKVAYGVEDADEPQDYHYRVALDSSLSPSSGTPGRLTWELLRNATHTYYGTDFVSGNKTTLSAYDIVTAGRLPIDAQQYHAFTQSRPPFNEILQGDGSPILLSGAVAAYTDVHQIGQSSFPYSAIYQTDGSGVFAAGLIVDYSSNVFANIPKISYGEMDTLENEELQNIRIINPANIVGFSRDYFKVVTDNI